MKTIEASPAVVAYWPSPESMPRHETAASGQIWGF